MNTYHELDLSAFGRRELRMLQSLLKALNEKNETQVFSGVEKIGFNMNSGMVFLVDDNHNVAIEENGSLVDFLTCFECGNEGLIDDLKGGDDCCKTFVKELSGE